MDPTAKYISQKISRTRWRPVPAGLLQQPEVFAAGSWDNESNRVSIWSLGDDDSDTDGEFDEEPRLLCDSEHDGDVMDLQALSLAHVWERAHRYSCDNAPCTAVVCRSPELVSVGEDGRVILYKADQTEVVRVIENADSSTIHAVTFLRTTEVLTVNSIGQLKMWDFRQQSDSPAQILSLTGDRVPLHCVDKHPNQQHIVATGGQDGMLCIWDVRQGNTPFSLIEAHSAEMWEVHFHPSNPNHLFTCSEDGSLLHWETTSGSDMSTLLQRGWNSRVVSHSGVPLAGEDDSVVSSWLAGDSSKNRLEATHMLPSQTLSVNSLDVLEQCLVCGTDGEAVYVHRQLPV
uniref:Nucleoporin 43 n=1 Tax=Cyprinus carpio TaxID=7962 RepID=A0A8C1UJM9_CYPCA